MTDLAIDFDWVKAIADCHPFHVLQQLRVGVEADVKSRNETLTEYQRNDRRIGFRVESSNDPNLFFVQRNGANVMSALRFSCDDSKITVGDERNQPILAATLTLNDEKLCRLKVDGVEIEHWQFRRRALHALFFVGI